MPALEKKIGIQSTRPKLPPPSRAPLARAFIRFLLVLLILIFVLLIDRLAARRPPHVSAIQTRPGPLHEQVRHSQQQEEKDLQPRTEVDLPRIRRSAARTLHLNR